MRAEKIEVTTKRENGEKVEWSGDYEVPSSLQEAAEKFGEEVIYNGFISQLTTNVSNLARAALREGKDPAAAIVNYIPGQKRERAPADPTQAILGNFSKLDAEAKKAMIAQLRAALQG